MSSNQCGGWRAISSQMNEDVGCVAVTEAQKGNARSHWSSRRDGSLFNLPAASLDAALHIILVGTLDPSHSSDLSPAPLLKKGGWRGGILVLIETYENPQCDRLPVTQLLKPLNEKVFQETAERDEEPVVRGEWHLLEKRFTSGREWGEWTEEGLLQRIPSQRVWLGLAGAGQCRSETQGPCGSDFLSGGRRDSGSGSHLAAANLHCLAPNEEWSPAAFTHMRPSSSYRAALNAIWSVFLDDM